MNEHTSTHEDKHCGDGPFGRCENPVDIAANLLLQAEAATSGLLATNLPAQQQAEHIIRMAALVQETVQRYSAVDAVEADEGLSPAKHRTKSAAKKQTGKSK